MFSGFDEYSSVTLGLHPIIRLVWNLCDQINSISTFLDIRSWYKNDPNWPQLKAYLDGGQAPIFRYHRFWEQADVALALGAYGMLFNE